MMHPGNYNNEKPYSIEEIKKRRINKARKTAKDLNSRIKQYLRDISETSYITPSVQKELSEILFKDIK